VEKNVIAIRGSRSINVPTATPAATKLTPLPGLHGLPARCPDLSFSRALGGGVVVEPLVSIVIPTYNRGSVIKETLDSALAQSYPHREVIVVDDGSTDATAAAAAPYLDRVKYIRQANQGLAAARNTGHTASSGDFIAWLDSDDVWNREKLALQVAFMQQHPDHDLVASDFSAFDAAGLFEPSFVRRYYSVLDRTPGGLAGFFPERRPLAPRALPHMAEAGRALPESITVYCGDIYDRLVDGNCLHPPTVLFRREAAGRAGALDPAMGMQACDYEFLVRLSRQGRVAFIDHPLMRYRLSPDQMSSEKHLVEIALSRLRVLWSMIRRDPALLASRAFRHRLGYSHLAAAHGLADGRRGPATRHLLQSLRWGYADDRTARTAAKLCLPRWVVERIRARGIRSL
jgi:glycosyltransferase involved in cell wall biosynthesis